MKRSLANISLLESLMKMLVVVWTIIVAASLTWSIVRTKKETLEIAQIQAHISYIKDIEYRRWNAKHGGVYVPVTEDTPPNPYLTDVSEREIRTPSGKLLTLVNPAYMTRQVHEMTEEEYGLKGHITSLKPIRPGNAPDPWEAEALRELEKEKDEITAISEIGGKYYFRLMHSFKTEKTCLKCHAGQGYREGDTRGGISVSIPMGPMFAIERRHILDSVAVHGLLWIVGLVGISFNKGRIRESEQERRHAEETVTRERDKAQQYLDIAGVMFVVIDAEHRVTLINRKGCECLGYNETEIIGQNWFDHFIPEYDREGSRRVFLQLISGETALNEYYENSVLTRSGSERLIAWHNAALKDEKGNITGTLSSGEDITERKEAEKELRKMTDELSRSNTDLQQFAYAASHDLQEPLRAVAGFVQLLEKRYKDRLDEKGHEFIDYTVDGVKRMQSLIRDLLEYSRLETKKKAFESVNCSVALEKALWNLHKAVEESKSEITYDLLPTVTADASQITSLFQNLIGNALKFKGRQRPEIHISAYKSDDEWIFSVRDNGIGIDPAHFERIFSIFQRLHTREEYEGTGVGLTICKRIVERHGGRIWVESESGKGSVFYFTMPDKTTHGQPSASS